VEKGGSVKPGTPKTKTKGRAPARPEGKSKTLPVEKKKSTATSKPTAAELSKEFRETAPMLELARMLDQVLNDPDETTQRVTVEVSKPLIDMIEFQERADAAKMGRAPSPTDKILTTILDNVLQEELHWLVTEPVHFIQYRDLWNAFCDERGAPEHKIGVEPDDSEGPFYSRKNDREPPH
jgi:hypothetical protein